METVPDIRRDIDSIQRELSRLGVDFSYAESHAGHQEWTSEQWDSYRQELKWCLADRQAITPKPTIAYRGVLGALTNLYNMDQWPVTVYLCVHRRTKGWFLTGDDPKYLECLCLASIPITDIDHPQTVAAKLWNAVLSLGVFEIIPD